MPGNLNGHLSTRPETLGQTIYGDFLIAHEAQCPPAFAFLELQGDDAHANQVGAMNALEALRDYGTHAQEFCALGGPVARGAGAVFLAGKNDQWRCFA